MCGSPAVLPCHAELKVGSNADQGLQKGQSGGREGDRQELRLIEDELESSGQTIL